MAQLSLMEWIAERAENCSRIAATKSGADRESWLEDERYFAAALEALARLQLLESGTGRAS